MASGVLATVISHPLQWFAQAMGTDPVPSNTALVEQVLQDLWIAAVFVLVVFAPITKELVFRKFLLARFLKAGYPALRILITSVLFGLMHEPYPRGEQDLLGWALLLVDYSLAGALFAAVYYWTGRIGAAIAAHATNNLVVALSYWVSL